MAIPGSHPANQSAGSGAADPQRPGELENHWKITEKTMGRPAFLDGSWILEQFPREDADEDLIWHHLVKYCYERRVKEAPWWREYAEFFP